MADEETTDDTDQQDGRRAIGDMNGKWAFLLKAVLITTPAAWAIFITVDVPWRVWVTRSTFETIDHQIHANELNGKLEDYNTESRKDFRELERRMDMLPPPDWQQRIKALETWERENKADHAKILIVLEAIKANQQRNFPSATPDGAWLPNQEHGNVSTTALGDVGPPSSDPG